MHAPSSPRQKMSHDQQGNGYDWRQDTPFWNNGNKPSRTGTSGQSNKPQVPGNKPKLREEPWTHLHGPASLWPAGQHGYPPGLFFGRKAGVPGGANAGPANGNFYPSFNVANPKNPSNVSRNVLLTPPKPAGHPAAAHHQYAHAHPAHHNPVAFAAAAAARLQRQLKWLMLPPSRIKIL